ncbi:hypothetical protein [Ornithinimicrobium avium]|uniref:Uncharacterized protein n=1 Tax=Ornithinimicrobium avium TaxID=2283195 RepID=A0A345NNA3_9MICO|nr:hypothetical protein [Ornithinimicrobium avium]AXH96511.1 hypothetical protein DV701_10575 [Ornithinimicrobium avium]
MSTPPVLPLHVLGTDVDVRVVGHEPEHLLEVLRARWHLALRPGRTGASTPAGAPAPGPLVVEAGVLPPDGGTTPWTRQENTVHDQDLPRLLQRLTQSITHAVITARTGELLMLHAAGLADPGTGATAAFVAPGNTGKTTLCRTLGPTRAYVTDETVGVRRDGTIAPYLKPLSTRRDDWAGTKDEQAPGEAGLSAPRVAPWLAGVVLLRREPDHPGPPRAAELDVLDAVLELTPESSGFMRTDGPLRWLADVLHRTGGARSVVYAEARDLEPLAAQICARRSPW